MRIRALFLAAVVVGLAFSLSRCAKPRPGEAFPPFTLTIDSELAPVPATLPDDGKRGPRPLAAVRDRAGVVLEFIANEIVVVPRSQRELDALVARYKGTIVGDNRVPPPPARLGVTIDPAAARATEYLIRIDPSGVDFANVAGAAARARLGGAQTVSSELGARLLAVTIRETADGLTVAPNFSHRSHAVLRSTRERPTGLNVFDDAFKTPQFPRFQSGGSRASVTAAWQWVAAHGIVRRVRVAIIDGGFWLDAAGQPFAAQGGSDLPAAPIQYDFVGDDPIAGAINPAGCSGGSPCPWHGNGSASVATGIANNGAVAAGSGGTVADPWLFHTDIRDHVQRDRAVRTAVAWGADVISMSFGGPCNYWCRWSERLLNTDRGYRDAVDRGVVLVASAGNTPIDVGDDNYVHPCLNDGVICVGELNDDLNTAWSNSSYGAGVDMWAPSDINAMTNGNATAPVFTTFGGTSASAPFVAGIAAMVKAINPALTTEQVAALLRDSAWTDSPDPKVTRYVNALEAVRRASSGVLPRDRFEPNDSVAAAKPIAAGQNDDLTLHDAKDRDYYTLSVGGFANVRLTSVSADDIGRPYVNFSKTDACGGAAEVASTSKPNERSWTYAVTPGQYLVSVSADRPLPYDLGIATTATALARDAFEGAPDNDDFARAFPLGKGGLGYRNATIVPGSDVDFYRVDSTGSIFNPKVGGKLFTFAIELADMPVTVDLFDAAHVLVKTVTTSPGCRELPKLTLPAGTFFVRVRAAAGGSYSFAVGERHESGILYDMRSLWRLILDPGGPVEFVVRGPDERFVFVRGDQREAGIDVIGAGLHARLLDSAGNAIAEGRADPREGARERIPLDGTIAGESYIVELSRDIGMAPSRGMRLPIVRATIVAVPAQ